jgi:hypothetical protein
MLLASFRLKASAFLIICFILQDLDAMSLGKSVMADAGNRPGEFAIAAIASHGKFIIFNAVQSCPPFGLRALL